LRQIAPAAVGAPGLTTQASSRPASRRAVVRRLPEISPALPRPRAAIAVGPAACDSLRQWLQAQMDAPAELEHPAEPAAASVAERPGCSVAIVDVAPVPARAMDHPEGRERLFAALGARLADVVRTSNLLVRPAPGRFVLGLAGVRDDHALAAATRRIADLLSRPVLVDGLPVRVTISTSALSSEPGETADQLLARLREPGSD
jgi:hypothetical protein